MGRHIKLYMLGYVLGPYELMLNYGLGSDVGKGMSEWWKITKKIIKEAILN